MPPVVVPPLVKSALVVPPPEMVLVSLDEHEDEEMHYDLPVKVIWVWGT